MLVSLYDRTELSWYHRISCAILYTLSTFYRMWNINFKLRFKNSDFLLLDPWMIYFSDSQSWPVPHPRNPGSWAENNFNKSPHNCDIQVGWEPLVHSVTTPWIGLLPQFPCAHAPASWTSRPDSGKSSLTSLASAECATPVCGVGTTAPNSTGCCEDQPGKAASPQAGRRELHKWQLFFLVEKVVSRE